MNHFEIPLPDPIGESSPATTRFSNEYLEELAKITRTSLHNTISDLASAALRLFDGARPLEIDPEPKPKPPKQDWLVIMNLATDFGNECSIEKRIKKLQELAADTKGKPVTILVQSAVKDGDKYRLERFALADGKIVKLESPGNSAGYALDVEQLLKFANKQYSAKNIGLILDSHGTGNGGLNGDPGNMSLAQMQKAVSRGLAGSGHDKLDLLQFNACLMGQNGVLESTQNITRHVVASAEPEGTGTQGRDFDNNVLAELLKKPSMTASDLAQVAIKKAKDHAEDFPTLAHFDMERYANFRQALDSFGEKLAKLCTDKTQLAVVQGIIRETYAYGGGRFNILNLFKEGELPDIQEMQLKPLPESPYGSIFDQLLPKPGGIFELLPKPTYESTGGILGGRCESGKRDLKDFLARVLLAISKGHLTDTDGSLRKAAQAVLIEGTQLIKAFFADGEKRKNIGGLSTFLPASPNDGGSDDPVISTTGGWRQFQQVIRNNLVPARKK